MHDLPSQTRNIVSCLTSKVRSDNPQLKRPTVEVEFDLIRAENSNGNIALHLVARDRRTGSYIYLAEQQTDSNQWEGEDSEFYGRIYLFVRHILRFIEEEYATLNSAEKGSLLKDLAKREFQMLIRL